MRPMLNIHLAFPTVPMLYNTKHAIRAAHLSQRQFQDCFYGTLNVACMYLLLTEFSTWKFTAL